MLHCHPLVIVHNLTFQMYLPPPNNYIYSLPSSGFAIVNQRQIKSLVKWFSPCSSGCSRVGEGGCFVEV